MYRSWEWDELNAKTGGLFGGIHNRMHRAMSATQRVESRFLTSTAGEIPDHHVLDLADHQWIIRARLDDDRTRN